MDGRASLGPIRPPGGATGGPAFGFGAPPRVPTAAAAAGGAKMMAVPPTSSAVTGARICTASRVSTALQQRSLASRSGGGSGSGHSTPEPGPAAASRPMTSNRGAGYNSSGGGSRPGTASGGSGSAPVGARATFDALAGGGNYAPSSAVKDRPTPEAIAKELESRVHALLEASAAAAAAGDSSLALERAKEAGRKERELVRVLDDAAAAAGEGGASASSDVSVNMDLTYAVCVNLGLAYEGAGLPAEALHTYTLVVRNRQYPTSWRLRVNVGNLHAKTGDCASALKQYRMALDQVPLMSRSLRCRINRNIGAAYVSLGRYGDAAAAFDAALGDAEAAVLGGDDEAVDEREDQETHRKSNGGSAALALLVSSDAFAAGYNLCVCAYALGDGQRMLTSFSRLAALPLPVAEDPDDGNGRHLRELQPEEADEMAGAGAGAAAAAAGSDPLSLSLEMSRYDSLSSELKDRTKAAQALVIKAARVLAPVLHQFLPSADSATSSAAIGKLLLAGGSSQQKNIQSRSGSTARVGGSTAGSSSDAGASYDQQQPHGGLDWVRGYDWTIDTLATNGHPCTAAELRMDKALALMERHHYDLAIAELKSFEKREPRLRARAAINLSFLYAVEGDAPNASSFAQLAVSHDRYNARALVNMGNALAAGGEPERAKEMYLEAIGVEADCCEAIYNLGQVNRALGLTSEAIQAFEKLRTLTPTAPEALYQLAVLYDASGNAEAAGKHVALLLAQVPTDAGAHAMRGELLARSGDDAAALTAYATSHRLAPVSTDVIAWLGVWHVKNELYERAASLFEHAVALSPPGLGGGTKWRLMAASCYRRMGALNKAFAAYEAVHASDSGNSECLRYLLAIGREIGKRTEAYQQALASLDSAQQGQQQGSSVGAGSGFSGGFSPTAAYRAQSAAAAVPPLQLAQAHHHHQQQYPQQHQYPSSAAAGVVGLSTTARFGVGHGDPAYSSNAAGEGHSTSHSGASVGGSSASVEGSSQWHHQHLQQQQRPFGRHLEDAGARQQLQQLEQSDDFGGADVNDLLAE